MWTCTSMASSWAGSGLMGSSYRSRQPAASAVNAAGVRSPLTADDGGRELGSVADTELRVDVLEVGLDGAPADEQPRPDLGVGQALGRETSDVELGGCQRGPPG